MLKELVERNEGFEPGEAGYVYLGKDAGSIEQSVDMEIREWAVEMAG